MSKPQRRPLNFITREKEWELLERLLFLTDTTDFDPATTAVVMVSPDYSATVAMHLAHAWSKDGEMLDLIPVSVTYPDEIPGPYIEKMTREWELHKYHQKYNKLIMVEAGIIRGGNWRWILDVASTFGYSRDQITLVAMCENIHSAVKSDVVAQYYDDEKEELVFYFERYNKHWPVK